MKNYVKWIKNDPFHWLYETNEATGNNKYICDSYKILELQESGKQFLSKNNETNVKSIPKDVMMISKTPLRTV